MKNGAKQDNSSVLWVKVGSVSLPIYPLRDKQGLVTRYCVVYRPTAKAPRRRITRVRLEEAEEEARKKCIAIANGQTAADHLSAESRLRAAAAISVLTPLGLTLDGAAREIAEARQITGGASIPEMARYWAQHHRSLLSRTTASEVHAELIEAKRDLIEPGKYWHQLRKDLERFGLAFMGKPIGEITSKEILKYLRDLSVGWVRRNKVHGMIVTLFRFAKTEKYLPQDRLTEPELIPKLPKPRDTPPPDIFTVAQMEGILRTMEMGSERDKAWIPFVTLGAFAGLRIAETEKLLWKDILWEDGYVEIRDEIAKRTQRKHGDARFIQMPTNLFEWLKPWQGATGHVAPEGRFDSYRRRISRLLPEKRWGQNPLRHSWLSYSEAQVGDLSHVVGQAGNSVTIAKAHYLNPRMKREGVAWFSIVPKVVRGKIVVPMRAQA